MSATTYPSYVSKYKKKQKQIQNKKRWKVKKSIDPHPIGCDCIDCITNRSCDTTSTNIDEIAKSVTITEEDTFNENIASDEFDCDSSILDITECEGVRKVSATLSGTKKQLSEIVGVPSDECDLNSSLLDSLVIPNEGSHLNDNANKFILDTTEAPTIIIPKNIPEEKIEKECQCELLTEVVSVECNTSAKDTQKIPENFLVEEKVEKPCTLTTEQEASEIINMTQKEGSKSTFFSTQEFILRLKNERHEFRREIFKIRNGYKQLDKKVTFARECLYPCDCDNCKLKDIVNNATMAKIQKFYDYSAIDFCNNALLTLLKKITYIKHRCDYYVSDESNTECMKRFKIPQRCHNETGDSPEPTIAQPEELDMQELKIPPQKIIMNTVTVQPFESVPVTKLAPPPIKPFDKKKAVPSCVLRNKATVHDPDCCCINCITLFNDIEFI